MSTPAPADHAGAAELAQRAGRLLLDIRERHGAEDTLGQRGDREANAYLMGELRQRFPADAILSEEEADDQVRLGAERVWIIDPLDGTREYGEPGRTDWAVHVALCTAGAITAAAVALPARNLTLTTADPPTLPPPRHGSPRLVVSRSRAPALAQAVAAVLDAELVPLGSAGAKTMAVVLGEADIYLHAGGQYQWDSAAPVGVAAAAGLHTSRLDGTPLHYNQPDPYLPDLLVCRPELTAAVLAAIVEASAA